MFVAEFLKKIVEIILEELIKYKFDINTNKKRKFARELFAYYEYIKDYRSLCLEISNLIERERKLVSNRRMTPGTAKKIQDISDKMNDIIKKLFRPEDIFLFEHNFALDNVKSKHLFKNIKHKRNYHNIIELYDSALLRTMQSTYYSDIKTSSFLTEVSKIYIHWETQKISLINKYNEDILFFQLPNEGNKEYHSYKESLDKYNVIDFTNDDDYKILIDSLKNNLDVINILIEKLAKFIKENFTLDELL